ncbi:MAG: rhodanese-like domain-containing protein [Pseudomonadota bacterium]
MKSLSGRLLLIVFAVSALAWTGVWHSHAQLGFFATKEKLGDVMSASEAHEKALRGELVLVDVRSSTEWRDTGVPASGHAISMHQDPRVFVEQLTTALGGDPKRPLAVICGTGVRTTYLMDALKKQGFERLINVTEGMKGGRYGTGWLKHGLPVRPWSRPGDMRPTMGAGAEGAS